MTITPGSFTNFNPSVFGGFSEQGSPAKLPKGDTSNRGRGVRREVNVAQSKVGLGVGVFVVGVSHVVGVDVVVWW